MQIWTDVGVLYSVLLPEDVIQSTAALADMVTTPNTLKRSLIAHGAYQGGTREEMLERLDRILVQREADLNVMDVLDWDIGGADE